MADTDFVGSFLGPFGRWQLRSTLLVFLVKIPSAWFMACLIFTAKSPVPGEIYCAPPDELDVDDAKLWIQAAHRETYNRVEDEESYDLCSIYENAADKYLNQSKSIDSAGNNLLPCESFRHQPIYESIITRYDLFCEREALVSLTQSFHLLGVLIGGIIAYYLLKKISPRRVMLVGIISQIFFGIATGYAPTYELHLFFRCSVAATCSLMCIGIMILTDITLGVYKVSIICLFEQFWSIGVILLPLMSTFWDSWALVYVAITLPTLSFIVIYIWIPDSPRWLLKNGQIDEAKRVLLKAAKVNKKTDFVEDDVEKQLQLLAEKMSHDPPEAKWATIWEGDWKHKGTVFVAHICWSIYLSLYFAYLLHVRAMGRDYLEVNTIIAGLSEIVGTFIGLYLILNTRRKWLWASLLNIATSLISVTAVLVPDTVPPFQRMVIYMATAMSAKVTTSTSLALFITSMSEIVTKEKRKMCNHSGVTCSRTLVMAAPFIGFTVIFGQLVPQVLMAGLNIFAAILTAVCINTTRTLPKPPKTVSTFHLTESVEGTYKKTLEKY